ncbi:hypothetical protein GCM10022254_35500 [Actinomadura meridiana]|uniref:Uncharacterized protein n=1 Tax=Actinomadura meridiana TaxID=559626 RepID=A0ABP8C406_9ACTN
MTRWAHDHWADEDLWFYFEIDDESFVQRQVTLEGPGRLANVACSLQEWEDAFRSGTTEEYYETYGAPDEWSVLPPRGGVGARGGQRSQRSGPKTS